MNDIVDAKKKLYYLLFQKGTNRTNIELELMYLLSKDEDIQKLFDESIKSERNVQ